MRAGLHWEVRGIDGMDAVARGQGADRQGVFGQRIQSKDVVGAGRLADVGGDVEDPRGGRDKHIAGRAGGRIIDGNVRAAELHDSGTHQNVVDSDVSGRRAHKGVVAVDLDGGQVGVRTGQAARHRAADV